MWLPCRFGQKVMVSKWGDGNYQEAEFYSIQKGCFNKIDYFFRTGKDNEWISLADKDNGFCHKDVKNNNYIIQGNLDPLQVDLKPDIGDTIAYNEVFDTRKRTTGKLISITLRKDGLFWYHFIENTGTSSELSSQELLIREQEPLKQNKDGQLTLI